MAEENSTPRVGFHKILYLTDLSEAGRGAFPYAASLARRYEAELTVLHVVERRDFEKYLVGYVDEDLWEEIKKRNLEEARDLLVRRKRNDAAVRNAVDQFCQDTLPPDEGGKPYVTYDILVKEGGDPVETVEQTVKTGEYDLIVVSRHGHGVLEGTLLGDTARRIVRRCAVPVLVIPVP